MKQQFLLYAFCILISKSLSGQQLARKDVLADLEFLNRAVKYAHPVNYRQTGKVNIDAIVAYASANFGDSVPVVRYRFLLGEALQETGCVHTNVRKNPTIKLRAGAPHFFPLHVKIIDGKIYTVKQADSLKHFSGRIILAVNGVTSDSLVQQFMHFSPSDGGGKAFVKEQLNLVLSSLTGLYFNYPNDYNVQFADGEQDIFPGSEKPVTDTLQPMPVAKLANKRNALYIDKDRALLKVSSFHLSDKRFFRKAIKIARRDSISDLILDLRNNTGGNRKAAVTLTQQLVDSAFQYSIVESKFLQPEMYLSAKGRRQLKLAWIHYHLGDWLKHDKTQSGHIFTYRYKPSKNPFQGRIMVLQNGLTASSSTMVTSWLDQYTSAVFIGSQSGGGYNGNNGGSFPSLVLPGTGIEIKFPIYRLVLDPESPNAAGLVPDYPVEYTLEDYLNGIDRELEEAIMIMKSEK